MKITSPVTGTRRGMVRRPWPAAAGISSSGVPPAAATRMMPVSWPKRISSPVHAAGNWDEAEIVVARAGGPERVILRGGSDGHLLPTGHLVYGSRGELLAVAVDPRTFATVGTPAVLVSGIQGAAGSLTGLRQFDVSDTGTLVHVVGGIVEETDLVWADRQGVGDVLATETQAAYPRLSPDGRRLAYSAPVAGNVDVYVIEWARKARSRLTFDPSQDSAPLWTPDGKRLIYASSRSGGQNPYWQPADGTGSAERLTTSPNPQWPYAITRDGATLVYIELNPKTSFDISAMPLAGDRKPRPLLNSAAGADRSDQR